MTTKLKDLILSMDIKAFYQLVDNNLRKGGFSLFDKFKLDNSDLIIAVTNSDPSAVAEALNAWVNPNKPDGLERYALPIAIDNNNELIVGMLLSRKANPDVRGKDGESALYKAVFWENETLVRLLLDKGATPNFPNLDGKTPIQAASENGYKNIHALLTDDAVELKRMQLEKDQATHKALKEQAQKAKAAKLNKSLPNIEESTIIHTPEKIKAEEVKAEEAVLQKYGSENTPIASLIAAIKSQDSKAVKVLTDKVENLNVFDKGEIPLLLAIEGGKEKLAIFLVDHGADVFLKDDSNNYPLLSSSVQHQLYELLSIAFAKEADLAAKFNDEKQSFSPQFLAYMDPRMMDLLLQHGADPFFGGKDGISPIIKAIQKGSVAILPVLAKRNVSFDHKIEDKTLLQWAVEFKRLDWINGLITEKAHTHASPEDMAAIFNAAEKTDDDMVQKIVSTLKM